MIEKTIKINTSGGLTGATASQVANIVTAHGAIVQLQRKDGLRVYVSSPDALQILRLQEGDDVTIKADGANAQSVIDAIVHLLQS